LWGVFVGVWGAGSGGGGGAPPPAAAGGGGGGAGLPSSERRITVDMPAVKIQ
jgi:hypothetical protein